MFFSNRLWLRCLRRLRQSPITMNHIVLFFVCFAGLSILLPIILRLLRSDGPRSRARAIVEYTQKRGYLLVNPSIAGALDSSRLDMLKNPGLRNLVRASSDISDIEGLENGTGDWLAFTCHLRSKQVTIFNLSETLRMPNTGSGSIPYKVAKIRAAGLPRFALGRNSVVQTVDNVVGRMVGTATPAITLDRLQYPEFSAHYWLKGPDRAAVVSFLSAEKVRFVETAKLKGTIATNANYLVYFESGVLVSEEDFDSFIAKAEKIIANML